MSSPTFSLFSLFSLFFSPTHTPFPLPSPCGRIQLLRDIRAFFSTTFKITPLPLPDASEERTGPKPAQEYQLSCLGIGHSNVSKGVA